MLRAIALALRQLMLRAIALALRQLMLALGLMFRASALTLRAPCTSPALSMDLY